MLTDLQKQEIIKKYLAGAGSTSLGKEYGVHENSILKMLKKNNVPLRQGRAYKKN